MSFEYGRNHSTSPGLWLISPPGGGRHLGVRYQFLPGEREETVIIELRRVVGRQDRRLQEELDKNQLHNLIEHLQAIHNFMPDVPEPSWDEFDVPPGSEAG